MKMTPLLLLLLLIVAAPAPLLAAQQAPAGKTDGASPSAPAGEDYSNLYANMGQQEKKISVADPIEPFNRGVFWINNKLYFYLFKPVARAYRVVPEPARVSVSNFFSNVATPIRFVNSLLQLKFTDAGTNLARFVINSTWGIGGLFDPARKYCGLKERDEDLGQTFGHYGLGPGFYLVLPILGPSDLRDGVGRFGDVYLDPWTYLVNSTEYIAVKGVDMETRISLSKDAYEQIMKESVDPYLFVKNAYIQNRQEAVAK